MPCGIFRQLRYCYRIFEKLLLKNMTVFIVDVCVFVFVFVFVFVGSC
jgi:hypothetical protein